MLSVSWFIVIPGHWISQFFVVGSPNVEPLLCVEEDALGHSLKVAAKLTQHIPTSLVHYSQVNKRTGAISVRRERRGEGERGEEGERGREGGEG